MSVDVIHVLVAQPSVCKSQLHGSQATAARRVAGSDVPRIARRRVPVQHITHFSVVKLKHTARMHTP
jgi:hypothetical protein